MSLLFLIMYQNFFERKYSLHLVIWSVNSLIALTSNRLNTVKHPLSIPETLTFGLSANIHICPLWQSLTSSTGEPVRQGGGEHMLVKARPSA